VFKTPVPLRIVTAYGTVYDMMINTDTSLKTFTYKIDDAPHYVVFNSGNSVQCKVRFSKPKQDWLNQWLNSEHAIDRITALWGMRDMTSDPNVLAALESALTKDNFWGVRNEAASVLGRADFYTVLEILIDAYEKETDSRVRRTILTSIANVNKNSTEQLDTKWLYSKVNDMIDSEKSYYAIADGITAISNILDKKDIYDAVVRYLDMNSHVEIIRRNIMAALDSSNDQRSLQIFMEYADNGSTARLRNAAINGLGDFLNDQNVIDYLNNIVLKVTRSTQNAILNLFEKAKNPSSKPFLQEILTKSNDALFKKSQRSPGQIPLSCPEE
jgi:aminopeptidase N